VWQLACAAAVVTLLVFGLARRVDEPVTRPPAARDTGAPARLPPLAGTAAAPAAGSRSPTSPERRERTRKESLLSSRIVIPGDVPQISPLPSIGELLVSVHEPETLTVAALEVPELTVMPLTPGDKEPR
jgi:hypothetical protein